MADFTLPLDIDTLEITAQTIDSKGNITFDVVSTCTKATCHKCGKPATKRYGYSAPISVQHTSILDKKAYLRIKPVRYQCQHCDDHPTPTEQYDWCHRNAKVTKALEEYIMRCLINSTVEDVSKKAKIGYKTIVRVLDRQVSKEVDWSQYTDLEVIGIDEISENKLELLYQYSPILKQAHSYALKLTHILNTHSNRKRGMEKIDRWIKMVEKSDLKIFNTFIKTLKKYKPSIANYFKSRKNSGFVEGLNNKIKVIKRRCYGFFKTETYFQRLFLDLKGYSLYVA